MPPIPIPVGSPWELIAAVVGVAAFVTAAGQMAEAAYIRFGGWPVPRVAIKLLRANSRVSTFSMVGLVVLGVLALRGFAEVSTSSAIAMLVALGASMFAWRCLSRLSRSGHTEADRLERAGRIGAALMVLEEDVGFKGIQRLMKRQFTGGDPKVYKGIEKDFLEIARLVLAVKHASNAAARLGVPRDLTDAYWNRADSISRPTWRRFEVLATARRQGFLPPILTNAVGSTRWTLPSDGKAKSLRGQTAEDIASLKRLGEELVTETTMLATNLGDDYGDAAWWKDFLDAKREVHSEDGGWSAKQSRGQSRMDQLVPDLMAVAASRDTAELRYMRAVRGLVLIGLFFFPPFRNQLRHLW